MEPAQKTPRGPQDSAEISELEGVGPARVNAGYVAFDAGGGTGWTIHTYPDVARDSSINIRPEDDPAYVTSMLVAPSRADSMGDPVRQCKETQEGNEDPVEDLGEVTLGCAVYHDFATPPRS